METELSVANVLLRLVAAVERQTVAIESLAVQLPKAARLDKEPLSDHFSGLPNGVEKAINVAFQGIEAAIQQTLVTIAEIASQASMTAAADYRSSTSGPGSNDLLENREASAIQWLIAIELKTGKLPTVAAVCKASGVSRGVIYRMRKFVEVYNGRREYHANLKRLERLPDSGRIGSGFRTTDGGLEAIDAFNDDEIA